MRGQTRVCSVRIPGPVQPGAKPRLRALFFAHFGELPHGAPHGPGFFPGFPAGTFLLQWPGSTPSEGSPSLPNVPPLRQRPLDLILLIYFIFNLVAISYAFDIEQIVIPDTSHFTYPAWPPRVIVDLGH